MSNKTQLLNHNERLASVIQTLQGKAAGGGGASVETCTVMVTCPSGLIGKVCATIIEDGAVTVIYTSPWIGSVTLNNVVCGSVLIFDWTHFPVVLGTTLDNAELLCDYGDSIYAFKVTATAGATATITVRDDD